MGNLDQHPPEVVQHAQEAMNLRCSGTFRKVYSIDAADEGELNRNTKGGCHRCGGISTHDTFYNCFAEGERARFCKDLDVCDYRLAVQAPLVKCITCTDMTRDPQGECTVCRFARIAKSLKDQYT